MALTLSRFSQDARLSRASENQPPLRQSESGAAVRILQLALIDLGFPMPGSTKDGTRLPDGIFGNETAACVRGLQQANGLTVDAVVGRQTLAALEAQILNLSQTNATADAVETRKRAKARNLNSLVG
jgi:peptidoglycan hydrolase-like protein with peptidoglycan-binding domain